MRTTFPWDSCLESTLWIRREKKKKHRRRTHYDPWKGHRVSAVVWWVSEQLQRGSAQKGHHWQRWVSYYFWLGAGMGVTLYSKFQVSLKPMENKKIQILLIQAAVGYSRKLLPFLPLGKKGPTSIWLTILCPFSRLCKASQMPLASNKNTLVICF